MLANMCAYLHVCMYIGGRQWQTTAELLPRKPDDEGKTYVHRYGT